MMFSPFSRSFYVLVGIGFSYVYEQKYVCQPGGIAETTRIRKQFLSTSQLVLLTVATK